MTFKRFEEIVRTKYPEAEVFQHGEFCRGVKSKINVAIIFDKASKCYSYNGTYCEILRRIGIKAIYKHNLDNMKKDLDYYTRYNGTEDIFFGGTFDFTYSINTLQKDIEEIERNYIIV